MVYFYCEKDEDERRRPEIILRTLIHQLIDSKDERICNYIDNKHKDNFKKQQKAGLSRIECQKLLAEIADICPITICIDALDEVHDYLRGELLDALKYVIWQQSQHPVKIFATSRPNSDISLQLKEFPLIELQPGDNSDDIQQFIESELDRIIKHGLLYLGNPDFQSKLYDRLTSNPNGMYISPAYHTSVSRRLVS